MLNLLYRLLSVKTLFAITILYLMTACSSITKGTDQEIFVQTPDVRDASCTLTNSKKASYTVAKTPGYITVKRGGGDIHIKCEKENYQTGESILVQGFESMAMGNLLVGGIIGIAVDAASGAAYKYPDNVSVLLRPEPGFEPVKPSKPLQKDNVETIAGLKPQNPAPSPSIKVNSKGIWQGTFASTCNGVTEGIGGTQVSAFLDGEELKINVASRQSHLAGKYDFYGVGRLKPEGSIEFTDPISGVNRLTFYMDQVNNLLVANVDKNCPTFMTKASETTAFQDIVNRHHADIQKIEVPVEEVTPKAVEAIVPRLDLSYYEGYWRGQTGADCTSTGSYTMTTTKITINVSPDKVELNAKSEAAYQLSYPFQAGFYGVGDIAKTGHIRFKDALVENNNLSLKFDENYNRFYVEFDGKCTIPLRPMLPSKGFEERKDRVAGVAVKNDGTTIAFVSFKEAARSSNAEQIFDYTEYAGRWKGFAGPGCVSEHSWVGSLNINAIISGPNMDIDLVYNSKWGNQTTVSRQAQKISEGAWTLDGRFVDTTKVILKLDTNSNRPIVSFDGSCEVELKRA